MKHITSMYGQETNEMESTSEEFDMLREFLEKHGVLIRMIQMSGNIVRWQAYNPYMSFMPDCKRFADEEMKTQNWCR